MVTSVKTDFGSGGSGIQPGGSAGSPDLQTIIRGLIDDIDNALAGTVSATSGSAVVAADVSATVATAVTAVGTGDSVVTAEADVSETKGVADGLIAGAPTTPSSQAVDPGGETDWNINISAGYVFANSFGGYFAAQVDFDVSSGAKLMDIGQAMYAWLVAVEAGGVVSQSKVLGVAAALGAETIPDDAAITAGVGHANWTKLALLHASRTADAVVATTENPSLMEKWGGGATDLVNDLKAKYNAAVTLVNELKTRAGENKTLTDELLNDLGEARALANANKAALNVVVTLANALKTAVNAEGSYTQTVQKG